MMCDISETGQSSAETCVKAVEVLPNFTSEAAGIQPGMSCVSYPALPQLHTGYLGIVLDSCDTRLRDGVATGKPPN